MAKLPWFQPKSGQFCHQGLYLWLMSHKAFYQTLFQTEQLFRRADDALTFPTVAAPNAELLTSTVSMPANEIPDLVQPTFTDVPAVSISDPVLPPPVSVSVTAPVDLLSADELLINTVDVEHTAPEIEQLAALIEPEPTPVPEPEIVKESRPATPLISQKVLILVDEDLLPSDLLFLEKVLKAVHLDIQGVDLLNVHGQGIKDVDFGQLLSGKYIHHFFTFGVPFTRLNLDIMMDRYQPVRFEGITFLMADTLPAIEADVVLKKKLWESLKKVFLWR
ncbi:hypothetical protein [Fibrella aquatica]|jgi:hypothetical protein|uniref:hypothetical protein n=1 Tax=Fibrella aquatica TaxID=3242487 RepID=UPI0035214BC5